MIQAKPTANGVSVTVTKDFIRREKLNALILKYENRRKADAEAGEPSNYNEILTDLNSLKEELTES